MDKKKKSQTFLSIGEFSEVSRASIDSLRYYERKGVFMPAYVDPQTGYRYYRLNQIYEISIAKMCTEAGISLADLSRFSSEGDIIRLDNFFEHCEDVAHRAAREAEAASLRMEANRKAYVEQISAGVPPSGERLVEGALMLTTPLNETYETLNYRDYIEKTSFCIKSALNLDLVYLADQGALCAPDGTWHAFVTVHPEPNLFGKIPSESTLELLRIRPTCLDVRSEAGAEIAACFDKAVHRDKTRRPVLVREAWVYSLITGFCMFYVYYDVGGNWAKALMPEGRNPHSSERTSKKSSAAGISLRGRPPRI